MNNLDYEPVTLSLPDKKIIPVGNELLQIPIKNLGTIAAYNVKAQIPEEWTAVIQDSSQCSFIAAGESCTLTISSLEPYLAKIVNITGENTQAAAITLGFSVHDYLVYSIDAEKRVASVIYPSNAKSAPWVYAFWNHDYLVGALSKTDGYANTKRIHTLYQQDKWWNTSRKTNPGAAVNCMKLKEDGGNWYLPADRQMFEPHYGWGDTNTLNKYNNSDDHTLNRLFQLGLGNLSHNKYWTSTELDTIEKRDFMRPTAQATLLDFINYKGNRHDHSGETIPLNRNTMLISRCVKDIAY